MTERRAIAKQRSASLSPFRHGAATAFIWGAMILFFHNGSASAQPDDPMDMTDAFHWEALRLKDENGIINPRGLTNALAFRQRLMKFNGGTAIAGLPTGKADDYTIQTASQPASPATVGGVDPTKWTWLGPGNIGGRTRSLLADPVTSGTYYSGSVGGGVWKTTNSGTSWTPAQGILGNLAVCTMVMQPGNPKTIYVGTGEGYFNGDSLQGSGIYKTTDGGTTWTQLASTANASFSYVNRLAISPNGAVLLAATNSGLFRSTNGGTTFAPIANLNFQIDDVDFNPTDSTKCVCGCGIFNPGQAFYSTDGGITWTAATGLPSGLPFLTGRVETCYARANPSIVYASVDQNGGTIYSSSDGGQSYTAQTQGGSQGYLGAQGWYANALWADDPTDANRVIVGGLDLWTSTDGGKSLTKISTWFLAPASAHADHHFIMTPPAYNGTTNQTLVFANDGGIYKADNVWGAVQWTELNNNYGVTQFYGGAGNANTKVIVGGAQDNGSLRFSGNAQGWNTFFGGDGGFCAADQTNPSYFYGEYVYLQIHRSSDGGVGSDGYIVSNLTDAGGNANFIAPFIIDPTNASRMYGGGASLWVTNNVKANPASTVSWSNIKATTGSMISAIAVNPKNASEIWVGHNNGQVYKTTNGTVANPTWTQMGAGTLPGRYCERIAIDPTNGNTVFVSFGGFSANNVWRTTNGGTAWTAVGTTTLPQSPTHGLVVHPANNKWVYVGTEVGVFASEDGGTTWGATNQGPINVSVDELFFMGNTASADLVAVTHGRGMYKITPTAGGGGGGGGGTSPNYVQATYAAGKLTLTDDAKDNAVSVTLRGSILTVEGAGSTVIGTPASHSQSVAFNVGSSANIDVEFTAGGNDTVSLVSVKSGTVKLVLGDGNDTANLTYCNISTSLYVDGGPGTDTLTLVGTTYPPGGKTVISVP